MKNMKIPLRPAPSVEEAQNRKQKNLPFENTKRKIPPPRPPPPNFNNKLKSQSAWNLNQQFDNFSLIDWSPPSSPKSGFPNDFSTKCSNRPVGGSISSSFSSSTSSLASSKKSFEYETVQFNVSPWVNNLPTPTNSHQSNQSNSQSSPVVPQISVPTIIRPQAPKVNRNKSPRVQSPVLSESPPMPSVPPPSPPKVTEFVQTSVGIALYDFPGSQPGDLPLQSNDVVFLLRRINNEWLYGRVDDREGMFPANFVDIQVPLPGEERLVTALYEFQPQMPGDLRLEPGQLVNVIRKNSEEWLFGESNGQQGQFPANFVDRIPLDL